MRFFQVVEMTTPLFTRRVLLLVLFLTLSFTPSVATVVSWLPRINLESGAVVSEDLGSYSLFTCEGGSDDPANGDDRSCKLDVTVLREYLGGAGVYTEIGLLAGIFVLIGGLFSIPICLCRVCCCRGRIAPNMVKTRAGVKKLPTLSFTVCLILIFACFCVSTYSGNEAITENMSSPEYSAANSLHGLKNIIHTFEPSLTHTVLSSTSDVLAPAIAKTNNTLNRAVSIVGFIESFEILDETIPLLPNPHAVVDVLNATRLITQNGSKYLGYIIDNLDDINELVDGLNNDTDYMRNRTLLLSDINDAMFATITELNDTIDATLDFLNEVTHDEDGIVPNCVQDLKAIRRIVDGGRLTNVADYQSASTGSTGSTSRLQSGDMDGDSAEITEMNSKLIAINGNMTTLPNYTLTADRLVYLNDTIKDVLTPNGLMENLTIQMRDLTHSTNQPIPILYDMKGIVLSFDGILANLTNELKDTINIVEVLLPLIETLLPQFEYLKVEVDKLYNADALFPIVDIIIDQLTSINNTLIYAEQISDIQERIIDANETLFDMLHNGTLSDILDQLDDANATVTDALADADEELSNLNDFEEVLVDSINDYNISGLNDTIVEAIVLLESIDVNESYHKVLDFVQSLQTVKIDKDFVDSLYATQATFEQIYDMLERAIGSSGDYIYLAGGYCSSQQDVYCTENGDCSSNDCTSKGVYRCSTPIGATTCTDDSDCTAVDASSHCLADSTRASNLHGALVALADDSDDIDATEILAELEDILATSDVNLTDSTSVLDDGAEAIRVFNTSEILELIQDIEDGMSDFDTASITDQMTSTKESIDDVDFEGFIDSIDTHLDNYDRVANGTFIEDWLDTFRTVKDFMFGDNFLKKRLDNVKNEVLVGILDESGPSAAINHILDQIDASRDDLSQNQTRFDVAGTNKSLAEKHNEKYAFLDRAGASRYPTTPYANNDKHGALYYLFALTKNLTIGNIATVPYDYALASGIVANSEGYRYLGEVYYDDDVSGVNNDDDDYEKSLNCFTLDCFAHTMTIINTAPPTEVDAELNPKKYGEDDSSDSSSAEISREELMTQLWGPVLLLMGIGVLSLLCAFIPRCQKAHSCCHCCFLSCALLLLPFIFIISSIFFLLAIIGEDACTSGTAIGDTYIRSYGNDYCADMLSGTGTLDECKFNFTLPDMFGDDENITISLNVLDTYNSLFQQQCAQLAVDPFEKIAQDLADQIRPLPIKATTKAVSNIDDYIIQPPLMDVINSTAINYGQVMYDLIVETNVDGAHKVMSCESMSLVYFEVEETACGGLVIPGVWLIAPWYFVAWVICCCGLPASCCTLVETKLIPAEVVVGEEGGEEDEEGISEGENEGDNNEDGEENAGDEEGGQGRRGSGELMMQSISSNEDSPHNVQYSNRAPAEVFYGEKQVDESNQQRRNSHGSVQKDELSHHRRNSNGSQSGNVEMTVAKGDTLL